jgi:hypothetical protein
MNYFQNVLSFNHYYRFFLISVEKECSYRNFYYRCNVSPIHLHALLGLGNFTKDVWSACAPTAYEEVSDCRKFEKHRFRVYENKVLRRIYGPKRDELTIG